MTHQKNNEKTIHAKNCECKACIQAEEKEHEAIYAEWEKIDPKGLIRLALEDKAF